MRLYLLAALGGLALIAALRCTLAAASPSGGQTFEDPLEPLVPKQARSEQEEDHLRAIALFSTGRMFEQRQEFGEALRRYERALRYDPDAWSVLREMLPLAFSLDRADEALRYAVKYAQRNPVDSRLLRRGAEYLAASGDWPAALKLCEQAARVLEATPESPRDAILLQVELGRLYFLTGQTAKSAAAFARVLDALNKPDDPRIDAATRRALVGDKGDIYETMGSVLVDAKQIEAARAAFEQFHKLSPNAANLAVNLAAVEQAAGRPEATLAELDKYFQSPAAEKGIVPYEILSWALRELKRQDQFVPKLEALHQKQPQNASLAYFLGEQYLAAGRLDQAQKLLEQSVARQPTVQSYRRLAEVYRKAGQAGPLVELLGKILAKADSLSLLEDETKQIAADPKFLAALVDAAQAQARSARDENNFALRAVALLAAEAKRWDDLETLYNVSLEVQPKAAAEVLLAWGLGLLLDEQHAAAAAVLERGTNEPKLTADPALFYFYLAAALESAGKTDEALAAAKKAAEKQPRNSRLASRAPWVLYHAKRYDEAYKGYREVLDRFDDDYSSATTREAMLEARQVLAAICADRRELPEAVEWLEQVLDEFPDDPGANNDLGYLWADENQHLERAHRMIRLAVAADPENSAFRDSLGWVLFRLGRYGEALVELEKAAADEEPDAEVLDHLGDTYAKLGRKADAENAWKRALKGFKKQQEQVKMKALEQKLSGELPP